MTRLTKIKHEFVEYIPQMIEDGTIYISIPFSTAVHKCCCGCGNEVVTPLSPTDWELTYNGNSISLSPSIGNWGFDCKSHYWIEYDNVRWARRWSEKEIKEVRAYDRQKKEEYFGGKITEKRSKENFISKLRGHWR